MSWLLRLMLKEEFRVHASYSGRTMFLAFPFIITMFSLAIAVTSQRLLELTPLADAILLIHLGVFLYGLSVGAFGFLGRQYLERKNGTRNYIVTFGAEDVVGWARPLFLHVHELRHPAQQEGRRWRRCRYRDESSIFSLPPRELSA